MIHMLCLFPHRDISPDVCSFFWSTFKRSIKNGISFYHIFRNFVAELECEHPFIIAIFVDDSLYIVFVAHCVMDFVF